MNKTKTIASKKDTSTLVRAVFGPGMLLQHDDLEQLNVYTRELSRLLFRSFFGCGVVCGLVVSAKPDCGKIFVTVGAGLALDCAGEPIYVPNDVRFAVDEDCSLDLKSISCLWVLLFRAQKCCAPRTSMCSCDDDGATSACTRERDCFEIRVVSQRPECVCYCGDREQERGDSFCDCVNPKDPCYQDHYDGKCSCKCEDGSNCDCTCVVLARLEYSADAKSWTADHSVRRFIRPVLMRDPQYALEKKTSKLAAAQTQRQPSAEPSGTEAVT